MSDADAVALACRLGISLQAARQRVAGHTGRDETGGAAGAPSTPSPPAAAASGRRAVPSNPVPAEAAPVEAGRGMGNRGKAGNPAALSPREPVGCRWIDGNVPGEWRYCQQPQVDGRAWCAEHAARVYPKGGANER